jgi:hypothetical protein
LPQHTPFDLSLGKDFGERFSASLTALNVANRRVEYGNNLAFGGFRWDNPCEIYLELRYRFHTITLTTQSARRLATTTAFTRLQSPPTSAWRSPTP